MNLKKSLVLLLSVTTAFILAIPVLPVFAGPPTLVTQAGNLCSSHPSTCTVTFTYTSSSYMLVVVDCYNANAAPAITVADGGTNSWTSTVSASDQTAPTNQFSTIEFHAVNSASGSHTLTVTNGDSQACNIVYIYVYVFTPSNVVITASSIATCHTGCSSIISVPAILLGPNDVAVAGNIHGGGQILRVDNNFQNNNGNGDVPVNCSLQGCSYYSTNSSSLSVTYRLCSVTNSGSNGNCSSPIGTAFTYWAAMGLDIALPVVVTVTTVVPPTIGQVQYWIFPILFLGMYDAFFLTHSILAKVSTKGLIYMMVSGFTLGSIVGLLMGFIGIQLVILCVLSVVVWWWRFR